MVSDDITVLMAEDGKLVARATCGEAAYEEELPTGFETWSRQEIEAHLRRFTVPRLKTLIRKHRDRLLAGTPCPENLTDLDEARLARAEAKRVRKAKKLLGETA